MSRVANAPVELPSGTQVKLDGQEIEVKGSKGALSLSVHTAVEVKQVDLPIEMQRAMARQAEAERDRRAKVINAEGEFQAAQKLTEAAIQMEKHPTALQLRYLQTLADIATENNSTTIFPIPIDLFKPFMNGDNAGGGNMGDLEGTIRKLIESQSKS